MRGEADALDLVESERLLAIPVIAGRRDRKAGVRVEERILSHDGRGVERLGLEESQRLLTVPVVAGSRDSEAGLGVRIHTVVLSVAGHRSVDVAGGGRS